MTVPPSITNYQIPTGKAFFTDDVATTPARVDLGNLVEFSVANAVTTKDHTRTYGGSRLIDKTITTLVAGTAHFQLDEISEWAIAMFNLGLLFPVTGGGGHHVHSFTKTNYTGILEVVGDNTDGPQLDWIAYVTLSPENAIFMVRSNDDWNTVPLQAKILAHPTYGFGLWTQKAIHEGLTA